MSHPAFRIALMIPALLLAPALAGALDTTAPLSWRAEDHLSAWGDAILADPLHAPEVARAVGARVANAGTSLGALVAAAPVPGTTLVPAPVPGALADEVAQAWASAGAPLATEERAQLHRDAAALDPRVASALATLVAGARHAEATRGDAFARLDAASLHHLVASATVASSSKEGDAAALLGPSPPVQLDATSAALAQVDTAALWRAHAQMAAATDAALAQLGTLDPRLAPAGEVFRAETPYGPVVVTGSGQDTHVEDRFVSIDLGGDDAYLNRAGGVRADLLGLLLLPPAPAPTDPAFPAWVETAYGFVHRAHNASIAIDLAGHDQYLAATPGAQGFGGFGGFGALVDVAGDDTYRAPSFAQGAGQVGGAGFLLDLGGRDTYDVGRQGQGYAQDGGGGFLVDAAEDDLYHAEVLAQGTGFNLDVVALLADVGGDDEYACTGIIDSSDSILPVQNPRPGSICQGTGFGGTGILVDQAGHDLYQTASSFQSMSLIGTAILADGAGDDRYLAGEWSQAVGVLGAAVLVDEGGRDRYSSVATVGPWADIYVGAQGEGYLGVGVLADAGGDDAYAAAVQKGLWLPQYACAQACSYVGGFGLLAEGAGDDTYDAEVGQGGAFLGTAVLVDAAGNDDYHLSENSTRGQAYGETGPLIIVVAPVQPSECQYAILYDAEGSDAYNNPVTVFGTRTDDAYWGNADFARGIDGRAGTLAYATSPEFQADAQKIVATRSCETLSGPATFLACALLGDPRPPC